MKNQFLSQFQTVKAKEYTLTILLFFLSLVNLIAVPIIYQAENGVLTGTNTTTATAGYTGTGYVTGFDAAGDAVQVTVNVATGGIYNIYIRYRSPSGDKTQDLFVNGVLVSNVVLTNSAAFATVLVSANFNAGNNTLAIRNNWGYVDIDNFGIELKPANVYNITPNLINTNADAKTKALYALLRSQYGHCIFTGQTNYWNELIAITGKSPAVRGFDMQNYSPMNPWGWSGCCNAWGGWDDGSVQQAIDWYNSTGGKGIVTFHWHWFSPSGGALSTSTFYTPSTNFDISRAVVVGNQEYIDAIRDIDAIAVQLRRLQTAGVPVIWRPLHEAGGAWFWWGARGANACKAMYDIMYNRLTVYHGINNLIWAWSTPEPTWYPGNAKVDIIGYDSYPGAYNYTTQKGVFDQLNTIVGGQKLVAMTENGPIPTITQAFADDAPWSYFMSWVDLVALQNTNAHIITSFNQGCNLADVVALPVTWLSFSGKRKEASIALEWTTAEERANSYFIVERSSDGKLFEPIGKVEHQQDKQKVVNHYGFVDENPLNTKVYYRLKQVDFDENYSYSSVVLVENSFIESIGIFPNPGSGIFFLRNFSEEMIEEIKIFSTNGNCVLNLRQLKEEGSQNRELDLTNQPAGIYLMEINLKDQHFTKKLIKLN